MNTGVYALDTELARQAEPSADFMDTNDNVSYIRRYNMELQSDRKPRIVIKSEAARCK